MGFPFTANEPDKMIKYAKEKAESFRYDKNNQLRKFYSEVKTIERLADLNSFESKDNYYKSTLWTRVLMMKPQASYTRNRDIKKPLISYDFEQFIVTGVEQSSCYSNFKMWALVFEAIIGFHKEEKNENKSHSYSPSNNQSHQTGRY